MYRIGPKLTAWTYIFCVVNCNQYFRKFEKISSLYSFFAVLHLERFTTGEVQRATVPKKLLTTKTTTMKNLPMYEIRLQQQQNVVTAPIASPDHDAALSPFHNQSMLFSMLRAEAEENCLNSLKELPNITQGISRINFWLKKREIDFLESPFLVAFLCHLLENRRLPRTASANHILRMFLTGIAHSDFEKSGASLGNGANISNFKPHFPIVFLDSSEKLNFCFNWARFQYAKLKRECELTLGQMDSSASESIVDTLRCRSLFTLKYDDYFHLTLSDEWLSEFLKTNSKNLPTVSGNMRQYLESVIYDILLKALETRVLIIDFMPSTSKRRNMAKEPAEESLKYFTIGLLLNQDTYSVPIEKGPPANSPEAVEFRKFWGEKSEMRKFADTSICETVVWSSGETQMQNRNVIEHIAKFVLNRHMKITTESVNFYGRCFNGLITPSGNSAVAYPVKGTGEEEYKSVSLIFDQLCQALRLLEGLSLRISRIVPVCASLRKTELYPVLPIEATFEKSKYIHTKDKWAMPRPGGNLSASWCGSLEFQIVLESSGKWPENLDAVHRLKTAFHIQISDLLKQQFQVDSVVNAQSMFIHYKGLIFHAYIAYEREIALLKRVVAPSGIMETRETDESKLLEIKYKKQPALAAHILALSSKFASFPLACRCFKRWICSHMMSGFLGDELLELLVASVYLSPQPYSVPGSFFTGFLRTLKLLASFDWLTSPLIVNLNDEISETEMLEIRSNFFTLRPTLPLMCVVTPGDFSGTLWSRPQPSAMIVNRLGQLATAALQYWHQDRLGQNQSIEPMVMLRPVLTVFDFLIHLNKKHITRRFMTCHILKNGETIKTPYLVQKCGEKLTARMKNTQKIREFRQKFKKPKHSSDLALKNSEFNLPIVDYDPVEGFLADLQEQHGKEMLFFYDRYGGSIIGVLVRPGAEKSIDGFTISTTRIGQGIVENIEIVTK